MAHRSVDRLSVAGRRAIAPAIVWRAKVRAAFQHLSPDLDLRLTWIEAFGFAPAARIARSAARFWRTYVVLGFVPVAGPFPDIANHIEEAIAIRRERLDWRGALISGGRCIFVRE